MLEPRTRLFGGLIVAAAAACFSVNGPWSRLGYRDGLEPLGLVTWRVGLGAAVLLGFVLWRASRGRPIASPRALPARVRAGLIAAGGATFLSNLLVFAAFERMTVAIALLTFYTYPVMVTVAVAALHRERPTSAKLVALVTALVGVVLVVASDVDPAEGLRFDAIGFLLALGGAAAHTSFVLLSRNGYRGVSSEQSAAFFLAFAFVGFVALAVAVTALGVAPGGWGQLAFPLEHGSVVPTLVLLGVVGGGAPYLLYLVGLRMIGAMRTAILAMLEPVVAVAMAAILLGESIAPLAVAGGALVLGAGVLLQRAPEPFAEPEVAEPEVAEPEVAEPEVPIVRHAAGPADGAG
ncbi:MAG: hypothetical protein A2X23_11195 [Chloroflexi bacterium GWC2_73_18]|nr:MAG: hypothetical protein A2X23_11195 [Chloroflexi bacterium GWC2_73_18]